MDQSLVQDIANSVVKYKLYPYFNACNYLLMSMAVREDAPQSGNSLFSRRHPFACWLATMLMCFASNILTSFLLGDSVLGVLEETEELILATLCWYAVNYCPFDLVYKLNRLAPVRFLLCILKEVQRTKKIHKGVKLAMKYHPKNMLMWLVIGTIKGSAYSHLKMGERLIRGVWLPASNEFLKPSFTTKASLAVSLLFTAVQMGRLDIDRNLTFLIAMTFLIYFRIIILILGVIDPFAPLENIVCGIIFGGVIDAIRNAWKRAPTSTSMSLSSSISPTAKDGVGVSGGLVSENGSGLLGGAAMANSTSSTVGSPTGAGIGGGGSGVGGGDMSEKKKDV